MRHVTPSADSLARSLSADLSFASRQAGTRNPCRWTPVTAERTIQWIGGVASPFSVNVTSATTDLTAGVRVTFTPPSPDAPPLTPWTVSLPAWGVTDVGVWQAHGFLQKGGCVAAPLELFSDGASPGAEGAPAFGTPLTVARWPNIANPGIPYSEWTDEASWDRAAFVKGSDTLNSALYTSDDAPFGNWTASLAGGNVYWTGYPFFDWADGSVSALSFNSTSHLLSLTPDVLAYNVTFSAKYFMQNVSGIEVVHLLSAQI